jgi:hypothetical protein
MRRVFVSTALLSSAQLAISWLPAQNTGLVAIHGDHDQPTTTELHHRRTAFPASILALTTTFTPSVACLDEIYIVASRPKEYYASLGTPNISDCYPPGWSPATPARFSPEYAPPGTGSHAPAWEIQGVYMRPRRLAALGKHGPSAQYTYVAGHLNISDQQWILLPPNQLQNCVLRPSLCLENPADYQNCGPRDCE